MAWAALLAVALLHLPVPAHAFGINVNAPNPALPAAGPGGGMPVSAKCPAATFKAMAARMAGLRLGEPSVMPVLAAPQLQCQGEPNVM